MGAIPPLSLYTSIVRCCLKLIDGFSDGEKNKVKRCSIKVASLWDARTGLFAVPRLRKSAFFLSGVTEIMYLRHIIVARYCGFIKARLVSFLAPSKKGGHP